VAAPVTEQPPRFTSETSLVEVYATVTGPSDQPVRGLRQTDFAVFEDGRPQPLTAFVGGDFPLSVAVAIDRSFSMPQARIDAAAAAARQFVESLRAGDAAMVIAIGSEIETLAPLQRGREAALRALERITPWGTTPLYDATLAALDAIQNGSGRRALVLFTDGADRYSETEATAMLAVARSRDVLVYPIVVRGAVPPVLNELAAATGARAFAARSDEAIIAAAAAIGDELRGQYLLGYAPERPFGSGEWRSITVRVKRSDLRVRAREGYFAR
jgi:Ca-activated chloride channel family protein